MRRVFSEGDDDLRFDGAQLLDEERLARRDLVGLGVAARREGVGGRQTRLQRAVQDLAGRLFRRAEGADGFLNKPINSAELLKLVKSFLP